MSPKFYLKCWWILRLVLHCLAPAVAIILLAVVAIQAVILIFGVAFDLIRYLTQ